MDELWMNAPPRPPRFVWTDGPTYTSDGQVPCFAPFHVLLARAAEEELRLEGLSHSFLVIFSDFRLLSGL
jgi:hypothetical protein